MQSHCKNVPFETYFLHSSSNFYYSSWLHLYFSVVLFYLYDFFRHVSFIATATVRRFLLSLYHRKSFNKREIPTCIAILEVPFSPLAKHPIHHQKPKEPSILTPKQVYESRDNESRLYENFP